MSEVPEKPVTVDKLAALAGLAEYRFRVAWLDLEVSERSAEIGKAFTALTDINSDLLGWLADTLELQDDLYRVVEHPKVEHLQLAAIEGTWTQANDKIVMYQAYVRLLDSDYAQGSDIEKSIGTCLRQVLGHIESEDDE